MEIYAEVVQPDGSCKGRTKEGWLTTITKEGRHQLRRMPKTEAWADVLDAREVGHAHCCTHCYTYRCTRSAVHLPDRKSVV